jgi:hypothetical protein
VRDIFGPIGVDQVAREQGMPICFPPRIRSEQIRMAVEKFVQAHPGLLHVNGIAIVGEALSEAFGTALRNCHKAVVAATILLVVCQSARLPNGLLARPITFAGRASSGVSIFGRPPGCVGPFRSQYAKPVVCRFSVMEER